MRNMGVLLVIALLCLPGISDEQRIDDAAGRKAPDEEAGQGGHAPRPTRAVGLAPYEEIPVRVTPRVPAYSVEPDLSNVTNLKDFDFSEEALKLLAENLFFVSSVRYSYHFFPSYESNRYLGVPNFVTTDSILHTFHLFFDLLLKRIEEGRLSTELQALSSGMLDAALRQYAALAGSEWENAARRAVGLFAVASRLLDPAAPIPAMVEQEVNGELALIAEGRGINESPVMMIGRGDDGALSQAGREDERDPRYLEDYSQFIPRGRYTKTESLERYFKAMMWYGKKTFLLRDSDHLKTVVLVVLAMDEDDHLERWERICDPVDFFVGKVDDIAYHEFKKALTDVYGPTLSVERIVSEDHRLPLLSEALHGLAPPIVASLSFDPDGGLGRSLERQNSFRFMGQRFTMDALIFRRLLDPHVPGRALPSGLDIPAALGSDVARDLLEDTEGARYPQYLERLTKTREMVRLLPEETWGQNLYWGWLHALRPLVNPRPTGYPSFMRNDAWARKEMNTFLGSWAELKHDTILYAEQVMAEYGNGWEDIDDRGYVEPNPSLYGRVASLSKMIRVGLQQRGLIDGHHVQNLERLETLALRLKTIAEKELGNTALSEEDYELIRAYGATLEHFWLEVHWKEMYESGVHNPYFMEQNPAAIIADVATDALSGRVLQVGTGWIYDMYVIVPVEGALRIAKGAVYSYYEFPWPMDDRLNNSKWRSMLVDSPSPPSWTEAFRAAER